MTSQIQTMDVAKITQAQQLQDSLSSYEDLVSVCNSRHLHNCMCQNDRVQQLFNNRWDVEYSKLCDDGYSDDTTVIASRRQSLLHSIRDEVGSELSAKGVRCPLERSRLKTSLSLFLNSHYDLSNPVISGIVRKALEQDLLAFKMNLQITNKDLLVWKDSINGGEWVLNPLVSANQNASKAVINALETVSRIADGTLSKNLNVEVSSDRVVDRGSRYRDFRKFVVDVSDNS